MKIDTKLPKVGTTIFSVMSQLALQHKAVNLGQGFPDFEPPQGLRDALTRAMNEVSPPRFSRLPPYSQRGRGGLGSGRGELRRTCYLGVGAGRALDVGAPRGPHERQCSLHGPS